ncbi:putative transcription factor interactor and regulator CCHC(Zn) family [Helianthus annuus]|nr:putative transcription factor interactor and regulator CCHC(Zn) family [Helianthus annuus]
MTSRGGIRLRGQKCPRCGEYGHREKTCKNSAPEDPTQHQASTSKRGRGKSTKICESRRIGV